MRNKVYALSLVGCYMAMWNADMLNQPKETLSGTIYGSDKALKYSIKSYWKLNGFKILYFKHYTETHTLLTLAKAFEQETNIKLDTKADKKSNTGEKSIPESEVLAALLKIEDVRQFGATFATSAVNTDITGVVQIGQGINIWPNTNVEVIDIMSPFLNPKKEKATQSSLGSKIVVDEAHYLYDISVIPYNLDSINGVSDCYTEEDLEQLKNGLLYGATELNTNSKSGCENEFAMFIHCKDGLFPHFANLHRYVTMTQNHDLDLTLLQKVLKPALNYIDYIEVYYNPYILTLSYTTPCNWKFYDLYKNPL